MIHSARSTVPPVVIIIFRWRLFGLAIFLKVGTDVRKEICVKIMITTGRVCGSAEWINYNTMELEKKMGNSNNERTIFSKAWEEGFIPSIFREFDV